MATLPKTKTLALSLDAGWLTVWFNQPERRNPLTDEAVEDLAAVIESIKDQRDIRGITIRGKGGFFCAGGDLKGFNAMATGATQDAMRMSRRIGHVLAELNALPQVTVAVIEGAAMAGGLGVACCCDVTVGLRDAKFGFSETRIGITPAQIARYVLQKCGYSTGRRLMLTAARFKGEEAGALGVLDFVASNTEELEALEQRVKQDVLECAPVRSRSGSLPSSRQCAAHRYRPSYARRMARRDPMGFDPLQLGIMGFMLSTSGFDTTGQ